MGTKDIPLVILSMFGGLGVYFILTVMGIAGSIAPAGY